MEQNFQTSFIPKKPMTKERPVSSRPVNFLSIIAVFIIFTVLIATAGLYFYKGIAAKNIVTMQNNLTLAKNRFEPSKITELQVLDRRLNASSEILGKHIAITPIFEALQAVTMKSVRYTKFSYDFAGGPADKINVKMSGVTTGYSNLALQSDLFTQNKNFIDPVFSNLTLSETGNVLFSLEFSVDPLFVDYQAAVQLQQQ
jgi:hypothetical protein